MNIKEAIAHCEWLLDCGILSSEDEEPMKVVLAELEKKDKVINKMAEILTTDIHSKEWVINYYEREVEGKK